MDLQEAIEKFLTDTERRRSDVTVKRYGEAMELLQSYLALELIDPDSPGEGPTGRVEDVTAQNIHTFVNDFLGNRLHSNDRARRRYIAATRSFVQWLTRARLVPEGLGREILETLRLAARGLGNPADEATSTLALDAPQGGLEDPDRDVDGLARGDRFFQVLEVKGQNLLLYDVETAEEYRGAAPPGEVVEPGDLVVGATGTRDGRPWAVNLRLIASEEDLEGEFGFDADWEDPETDADGSAWDEDAGPMVEDALEILASEDRYAPREVVRVILANFEEARDDLMDWLTDDDYRNEPFPGAGEAPANAARLLSEVREPEALPRLLSALGDADPLGEEAPTALGRYGQTVVDPVAAILRDPKESEARRCAAAWALGAVAARNPAFRSEVADALAGVLAESPVPVTDEVLSVLEELRAVEVLPAVRTLAQDGRLDFEATDRTESLFASRVSGEGWGERATEALLPVLYLYPTSEELEEFYESLEEDLGDLWDLMGMEEDDELGQVGDEDEDEPDGSPSGGKVIPFKRPSA